MQRITVTALSLLVIMVAALSFGAESAGKLYDVTFDGSTYQVKDGVETKIPGARGEKEHRLLVRMKQVQSYGHDTLLFDYDTSFSLKDDGDKESRTVTLIHAGGASLVITDLGVAGDSLDDLLEAMVKQLKTNFSTDPVKDMRSTPSAPVSYAASKGVTSTITYRDSDNDQRVCKVYILASGKRQFGVILQYFGEDEKQAESLARVTLQSIRAR